MATGQAAVTVATAADRTYGVLNAMLRLGYGPHPPKDIIAESRLPRRLVYRRLQQLIETGLIRRSPGLYGHYELTPLTWEYQQGLSLIHPVAGAADLRDLVAALHEATGEITMFHAFLSLGASRVSIAMAGESLALRRALVHHRDSAERIREAPLQADAPGRAILAHMPGPRSNSPDLKLIRQTGMARSTAPLSGWTWLSVPVTSRPATDMLHGVAGSVSLLLPHTSHGSQAVRHARVLRETVTTWLSRPHELPAEPACA
jgi:DNA-binding IclR family transcriptional regulator